MEGHTAIGKFEVSWDYEDLATPALIEPLMLGVMGIGKEGSTPHEIEAAEATRQELIRIIKEEYGITMGTLEQAANGFYDGYLAALKRS